MSVAWSIEFQCKEEDISFRGDWTNIQTVKDFKIKTEDKLKFEWCRGQRVQTFCVGA